MFLKIKKYEKVIIVISISALLHGGKGHGFRFLPRTKNRLSNCAIVIVIVIVIR